MTPTTDGMPSFWTTVRLLLGAARMRSAGRRKRQQELLHSKTSGKGTDWGGIGFFFFVVLMAYVNGSAAFVVSESVRAGQRAQAELNGRNVVSREFMDALIQPMRFYRDAGDAADTVHAGAPEYAGEAKKISEEYGGSKTAIEKTLRDSVEQHGTADLIVSDEAAPGLRKFLNTGGLPAILGSIALALWMMMLTFQGEGLELDYQRRRHPMWEWLLSYPVPPGAVFLAEMLSPIAANPIYWAGPLFVGIVYGLTYDFGFGLLAAFLIGVPFTVAAACLGKALEIGAMLRLSSRSRGAFVGIMSWLGYASMMLFLLGPFFVGRVVSGMARFLSILTVIPWPWLGLFLGIQSEGSPSFLRGLLTCWAAAGVLITVAVWFSVWSTQQGLGGNFGSAVSRPGTTGRTVSFGREPLYRKEFLWFARDRSAIVQCLLVPITVASFQVFNLRTLLVHAQGAWNYLSGVAIFFGTYFLWILGPKSLQSEGTALWIALTWPRGLESLLKAKAWLWSMLSTGLVVLVLIYASVLFPKEIWKIALVGVGWFFFSRSMAEKSVTLVTVASSSGETEKVPSGRRWAAQLGMLTFAIGIVTGQWQLAIVGIVYSYVTAAAMWQNFRARLPFLYDPWSETMPQPPTLMHGMVSISIFLELAAMFSIPAVAFAGPENLGVAQAMGYGLAAIVVSIGVSNFLRNRNVRPQDIWLWLADGSSIEECAPWSQRFGLADARIVPAAVTALGAGLALGVFAHIYLIAVGHVPAIVEMLRKSQEAIAEQHFFRFWYAVIAIGFAPFAEEYLFRGLLFRALDREWGGWKAVVGSAAFFAVYHPPLSWLPVFLLGASNALLFKKTGRLVPCVLLHMVYNAVVLL